MVFHWKRSLMMIKLKIIMLSVLRIPSVNNTELLIMNELQDDEYRHMLHVTNVICYKC